MLVGYGSATQLTNPLSLSLCRYTPLHKLACSSLQRKRETRQRICHISVWHIKGRQWLEEQEFCQQQSWSFIHTVPSSPQPDLLLMPRSRRMLLLHSPWLPDTKGNKQIHHPVLVGDLDGLDREYWTSKRKICGSPTLNYMSQQLSYLQLHQSSTVIFCGWQQVQGLCWLEESFWTEALPIFQVLSIGEWGKDLSQHLHSRIRFCL